MSKAQGHKTFHLSEEYQVICWWENTRYGFRHLAVLQKNGCEVARSKACYHNRTWEAYTYQSVLISVIEAYFDGLEKEQYLKFANEYKEGNDFFKSVLAVCAFGDVVCESQKEKNDWKKRVLGTVDGIDFPDNFDELSEDEKEKRLDGALSILGKE